MSEARLTIFFTEYFTNSPNIKILNTHRHYKPNFISERIQKPYYQSCWDNMDQFRNARESNVDDLLITLNIRGPPRVAHMLTTS